MRNPNLDQPFIQIRNQYDATFDNPTQGFYNQLSGSINEFKMSNQLPNSMYDSVNRMQQNYGQQLGGLEQKLR